MDVWDKLPIKSGGGGIWDHLAADLTNPTSLADAMGLWGQISTSPGGLWREARDETLVLPEARPERENIWDEVENETLVLDGERARSVWQAAGDQLAGGHTGDRQVNLWDELQDETLVLDKVEAGGWTGPKIRDMARYRPVRALGWALKQLATTRGEAYYVLKNMRQGIYLKLNEQQAYVWNMMDGSYTVEDLAVSIFMKYKTFSFEWLVEWLGQLKAGGFLASQEVNVYEASRQQVWQRTLRYWGRRLIQILFHSEVSLKGIDAFYSAVYGLIGKLLFSRPMQIFFLLLILLGLPAFLIVSPEGALSVLFKAGGSLGTGLAGLLISQTILIFIHESAHALTTKHYGRTVRRGGFGLYFGMPAFFMDTTDIWMEPRGPRLAVTWAGPYSGFILGAMASLIILASPDAFWVAPLYQFATISYFLSALNLNPLLKLDGYYLLMDWLEIPKLRERSITFVRQELWGKLIRGDSFDREERIFAIFGILALIWTVIAIGLTLRLYGRSVYDALLGLFSPARLAP